jgi:hypothetical protein
MIELRPEQRPKCDEAKIILAKYGVVYIAGEVRTGKTPISLMTAHEIGWKRVCVLTKKKAIPGFKKFNPEYLFQKLTIINYINNAKNIDNLVRDYDGFIVDEAHNLGAFPTPGKSTTAIKNLIQNKPVIFLSGTPTPEGYSQIYHQFWVCNHGPFQRYWNPKGKLSGFYKWAKDFVTQYEYKDDEGNTRFRVNQRILYGNTVNDYSEAKETKVKAAIHPYFVYLTQQEAGFTSFVDEEIIKVPIDKRLYQLMKILKKDKYYRMKCGDEVIVDTSVRMQSLFHQLSSGTLNITIIEKPKPGQPVTLKRKKKQIKHSLDESKAWFIKSKFAGKKIAIFYKFVQEGVILRKVFENNTSDEEIFNSSTDKVYICQMISGREGVNISTADDVVMYNIDFSATTYWQIRSRMQEKNRIKVSKLWWIFSTHGIEMKIYKAVCDKKDYTLSYFKKDLKNWLFPV